MMIGCLTFLLFILILLVGGERGVSTIFVLIGNVILFLATVFMIAKGAPPILTVLLVGIVIIWITIIGQNGRNQKTVSAAVSTLGIMLLMTIVVFSVVTAGNSGGINEILKQGEDVQYSFNLKIGVSMLKIEIATGILSTLGALADTALSITSSVYEVAGHNRSLSKKELFFSGITVGKDIIGTTVNTLLFAYLGQSVLLFAYVKLNRYTLGTLLNSKFVFQEVSIMLFSTIGCLLVIPLASWLIADSIRKKGLQCEYHSITGENNENGH